MQKNSLKQPGFVVFLWCITMFCLLQTELYADDFFKVKERITKGAWKKVALFYITPTITLEDAGYASNIYSYNNLEEPDWKADLGLQVNVASILGNRFILSVNENPHYLFYAKNKDYRSLNNKLEAALHTYVGRFNLKYQFETGYVSDRPSSEFGLHVRTRTEGHELSLDYGRHENFFINLYLKQNIREYDDENYLGSYNLKNTLNREDLRAGINLNKIIFTQTRLFLNYEYYEYKFDYETGRDGIGKQLSLGVEFPEISRITGSLEFGLKTFDAGGPQYQNFTKPFGSGEVAIELFRKLRLRFIYLVDNFYSFWRGDQQYNEKSGKAGVEFYLTKKIKLGYSYELGRLSYENLTDGENTRQDDFHFSSISIGIKIFKKWGIGLEYRIYRSDSSELDFTRNNDFIGGHIIHEF